MSLIDNIVSGSEEWLQYAIRLNLLNESKEDLNDLRIKVLVNDRIKSYLKDITDFHSIIVNNHKNPDLPIHKLLFLLDIGLDCTVPSISDAITETMKHKDYNGVYQSFTNIPKHFGGSGENTFGWCLCDAPLLLLALKKADVDYEKHIKPGVNYLAALHQKNGFPCTVSSELGHFRGPGRKDDCCPYATLIMLKLFACIPEYQNSEMANSAVDAILSLWENSIERHPYMFYMGTDFRKLKAPAIWYDIVSVTCCLSNFESAKQDKRFQEMIKIIKEKQNKDGLLVPESVFQKFKGWDFGQKKLPSPYLTYLCLKIFQKLD